MLLCKFRIFLSKNLNVKWPDIYSIVKKSPYDHSFDNKFFVVAIRNNGRCFPFDKDATSFLKLRTKLLKSEMKWIH